MAALLALATVAAYFNSFSGTLTYDDVASITENESIRQLWPPGPAFSPPAESGTGGRPIANFTFAVSYALSGLQPWGHHLVSLLTHTLAALALFGVLRRTLLQPALRDRFGAHALPLAGAIAGLWAVHPLQTQVVTYLSQRTESLMALFYLLTLYCFIRGTQARARFWLPLSVTACLCGVMCKEVIVTAPLLVLLYDRTFVAGSFTAALRLRWKLYAALAATWLPLAFFLVGVHERGVGYGLGIPWFDYARTECRAVVLYLKLGLWPSPLVFDRGTELVANPAAAAPFALLLAALLGSTVWALRTRPVLGFVGAWFFVILAPASSVIPVIQQPIAENRPYLPLAALIALVVLTLHAFAGRRISLGVCSALAIAGIFATASRNRAYASEIALWGDTAAKAPRNARAHCNFGVALDQAGRGAEAIVCYDTALRFGPAFAPAHNNLGNALAKAGRIAEAIPHFENALRLRTPESIEKFERALALKPDFADAHRNLAIALSRAGRLADAVTHAEEALRLRPDSPDARRNADILRGLLQTAAPRN